MRYREIKPAPHLTPFVECFWTLENEVSNGERQPEPILPDGCAELILNFGDPFQERRENGREERQPSHFLVGQMTQPMVIKASGRVELLGIRFHPGGTFPFFHTSMHELTNRLVEIADLSPGLERNLITRVAEAPFMWLRIALLEKWLIGLVLNRKYNSPLMGVTAKIVRRAGQISVDDLSTAAGISNRQLERRFLREVGIGPKLLCRILRFQQVFRAVDRNDAGWAAVAADCGYYDQGHLIRDFQQFARQTPAVLFAQSGLLTQAFTRRGRASDFSNTPA